MPSETIDVMDGSFLSSSEFKKWNLSSATTDQLINYLIEN